jgi:hypothetical protein
MEKCLMLLKQDMTETYVANNPTFANYYAHYNLQTAKRISPEKTKWIKWGAFKSELVPNIYGSFQFVRGNFSPSMAAGLRYTDFTNANMRSHYFLMWEPYFFFSKDASNKLVTDRNDFITFRYTEMEKNKQPFTYSANFSIGYLAGRRGEWFEKNTLKVGLPAVRSGWLQLEPEFYFNNWFRNFSPTIKLTIHYE